MREHGHKKPIVLVEISSCFDETQGCANIFFNHFDHSMGSLSFAVEGHEMFAADAPNTASIQNLRVFRENDKDQLSFLLQILRRLRWL